MGGYGSGRWRSHSKKDTVEDGLKLSTTYLRDNLNFALEAGDESFARGGLQWSMREKITDSIGYTVENRNGRLLVRLTYTTTRWDGTKAESDYSVEVTSTPLIFGGRRWWWICPLVKNGRECNRRVGKLYLPPGARYFGCRHCYDLTYTSSQESHKYDSMFAALALSIRDQHPTLTGRDVRKLLEGRFGGIR